MLGCSAENGAAQWSPRATPTSRRWTILGRGEPGAGRVPGGGRGGGQRIRGVLAGRSGAANASRVGSTDVMAAVANVGRGVKVGWAVTIYGPHGKAAALARL